MKKLLLILPITICLFSCKENKEKMVAKKWQAVKLESPQMDSLMREQEKFIDTFGKSTDAATNMAMYGTANVDSMRESLRAQFKDYKAMQDHSIKNTWFDFKQNGVAHMNFSGQTDSANWYFNEEGTLVLDEMKLKGTGSKINMKVDELTDNKLKLTFSENAMTSTVTFEPSK